MSNHKGHWIRKDASERAASTPRTLSATTGEPDWDALPPVLYIQKRLQTPFKTERHDPGWFSHLTPATKLVALAISDRMHRPNARGEDQCWCSKDDIAERAAVDKRSVQRALQELKELQYPLFDLSLEKHRSYTFTLVRRPVAYQGLRLMRSPALRPVSVSRADASTAIPERDSASGSTPAVGGSRVESAPGVSSEARSCPPTPEFLEMCRLVKARLAAERARDHAGDKLTPSNREWVSVGRLIETNCLPREEADCLSPGDKLTPEVHPLKETPIERNRCRGDPARLV